MMEFLQNSGVGNSTIEDAFRWLAEKGLYDELRYAKQAVAARPLDSDLALRERLLTEQVSDGAIAEALNELDSESSRCEALLNKRRKTNPEGEARYLSSKGFPPETINVAIEKRFGITLAELE